MSSKLTKRLKLHISRCGAFPRCDVLTCNILVVCPKDLK